MEKKYEFYEKSNKYNKPSKLLKRFFDMKLEDSLKRKIAIDIGAGVGNDAKFLLEKGFKVTCIDKEEKAKEIAISKIGDNENFNYIVDRIENIKLHGADFIYECFCLQFCNPQKIDSVMEKIIKNISQGGFFVRKFHRK